jgi:chromosome segregation ATPase
MDSAKVKDALVQVALRMIPIIPANEVQNLIGVLTQKDSEIDRKVEEALKSLNQTSSVISQLEAAVRDKTDRLQKLQADYKTYEQLTELTKDQVAAISEMMQRTIEHNRPKEVLVALSIHLGVGIIFLIAGVILAHPIEHLWATIFGSAG